MFPVKLRRESKYMLLPYPWWHCLDADTSGIHRGNIPSQYSSSYYDEREMYVTYALIEGSVHRCFQALPPNALHLIVIRLVISVHNVTGLIFKY